MVAESLPIGGPATARSILRSTLQGQMLLAPLTRGGNLPFRRLCCELGAEVTMGEMIFARSLLKGERHEQARLRRAANEHAFGAQFATNNIAEGAKLCELAAQQGATWVDLNCGCPIYEATRRGLGSALLRKPAKLGRLVSGIVEKSPLPLSVKVRVTPLTPIPLTSPLPPPDHPLPHPLPDPLPRVPSR